MKTFTLTYTAKIWADLIITIKADSLEEAYEKWKNKDIDKYEVIDRGVPDPGVCGLEEFKNFVVDPEGDE